MDNPKLGRIIEGTANRDAIHMAIAPVVASERLAPGQHIGLVEDAATGAAKELLGIVDPFLAGPVFKGERFFMFLYPNTITSLRHEWEHPAFGKKAPDANSEIWLREFAVIEAQLSYESLLAAAHGYLKDGDYLCEGGTWEGFHLPDEFWDHFEVVTGRKVSTADRGNFFSCAC